ALRTPILRLSVGLSLVRWLGRPAKVVTHTDPDAERRAWGAEHRGSAGGVVSEVRPGEEVFAQDARRLVFEVEHIVDAPKQLQLIDDLPACVQVDDRIARDRAVYVSVVVVPHRVLTTGEHDRSTRGKLGADVPVGAHLEVVARNPWDVVAR